jgi:CBS domain-containing protein
VSAVTLDSERPGAFLAAHQPFDSLDDGELAALAASGECREFAAGTAILVEDGPPAAVLYVVLSGAVELLHQGEAIHVLAPGECFGHPSLLTGMAPAFTARVREDCTCFLLAAGAARRVLGTEAGAAYVARTMRVRLTGSGHTVHGLLDVGTTPVSAIMRPPSFCSPQDSIRSAAGRLGEDGVAALLVTLADGELGIVTDADVRAGLVERERSLEDPVHLIAHHPAPTVPVAQLAVEAAVDMLAAGADCVAVTDGEEVRGVLAAGDLVGLDARSPIALRHTIMGAADEDGLVRSVSHLPKLFGLLMAAGVPPRDLGRVLSLQHDAIVARLIEFSISRHAPAPVPWAWLDLGSAARREFTLASDQDNALAYGAPPPGEEEAVDAYFAQLGSEVNAGLARCGIGVDNNGVLAGKRLWRMSKADWVRTFDECFQIPDESHLIRATVVFDFRSTAGGLAIDAELGGRIRAARTHPDFMRLMARTASGFPVALGLRGQLAPEKKGDHAGRIDLKHGAVIPLVNLVRFHALACGVTISPTLDRIEAVASAGAIDGAAAEALSEAFIVVARLRFEHHASQIAAGLAPDNLIDPDELAPIARTELREALHSVRRGQKQAAVWTGARL